MNKFIKHLSVWASLAAALAMGACSGSGDSATVSLLPVKPALGESKLFCTNDALTEALEKMGPIKTSQVHPCVNNIIAIDRPAGSFSMPTLYRFDGNELVELATELKSAGFMNEDRIPVVRYGEAPVILDKDMNEVFRADVVDGIAVEAVAAMYSEGCLWFSLADGTSGCFDRDGKVVFVTSEVRNANHFFVDGVVPTRNGNEIDRKGNIVEKEDEHDSNNSGEGRVYSWEETVDDAKEELIEQGAPFDMSRLIDLCSDIEDLSAEASVLQDITKAVNKQLKVELATGIGVLDPREALRAAQEREATIKKAGENVLTQYGIGKIEIGKMAFHIPYKVKGVYDTYKVSSTDDDMSGVAEVYTCKRDGNDVIYVQVDAKKNILAVLVVDPAIKAITGAYVGMPESELKKISNVKKEMDAMEGSWYYYGDDLVYFLTEEENPTVRMITTANAF